jgi:hypothetical protein
MSYTPAATYTFSSDSYTPDASFTFTSTAINVTNADVTGSWYGVDGSAVGGAALSGGWYRLAGSIDADYNPNAQVTGGWYNLSGEVVGGGNVTGGWYNLNASIEAIGNATAYITGNWYSLEASIAATNSTNANVTGSWYGVDGSAVGGAALSGGWYRLAGSVDAVGPATAKVTGGWYSLDGSIAAKGSTRADITGGWYQIEPINNTVTGSWYVLDARITSQSTTELDQAFAMNIHTVEVTRYTNYSFNHIVHINGVAYGVKSDGLYTLDDADDNGTEIIGSLTTKEMDFDAYQSKRVPYVYLNSDSSTRLTPYADGEAVNTYTSGFNGRKTKIGRGATGRYWKFKIDNIEKLEGIELLPEVLQRRVK